MEAGIFLDMYCAFSCREINGSHRKVRKVRSHKNMNGGFGCYRAAAHKRQAAKPDGKKAHGAK